MIRRWWDARPGLGGWLLYAALAGMTCLLTDLPWAVVLAGAVLTIALGMAADATGTARAERRRDELEAER